MSILIEILTVILLSACWSSITIGLGYAMGEGQILAGYWEWLDRNKAKWWVKPLGYCDNCTNLWLGVFCIIGFAVFGICSFWWLMIAPFMGNVWLRLYSRI